MVALEMARLGLECSAPVQEKLVMPNVIANSNYEMSEDMSLNTSDVLALSGNKLPRRNGRGNNNNNNN